MANKLATLMWLCKTEAGWKRYPVMMAKNGRVRTGHVTVGDGERHYPEGRFQVRTFEGKRTVFTNAGVDPGEAVTKCAKMAFKKDTIARVADAGLELKEEAGRVLLSKAVAEFLARKDAAGSFEAVKSYRTALEDFVRLVPTVKYLDQVTDATLADFKKGLQPKAVEVARTSRIKGMNWKLGAGTNTVRGNSDRTVAGKHRAVTGLLYFHGIDVRALRIVKPKYDKVKPRVYSPKEVDALLAAAADSPYFLMVIDVLRMTGLREAEGKHLQWSDINYDRKLVHVRAKPEYHHKLKDREERDVPLPDPLATRLKAWQVQHRDDKLVLGGKGDKPCATWLYQVKVTARKAGLNCGICPGCKARGECSKFTTHSWRRTYATSLHRKGVDARTLMEWLGHSDMATTMAYLAPMNAEDAHLPVHAAFS